MSVYPHPVAQMQQASVAARRQRSQWLAALSEGMLSPAELIETASDPEAGRPLRVIPLRQVLGALPGWSNQRVDRAMAVLRRVAGVAERVADDELDVAWVIDERSPGVRRLVALAEALVVVPSGDRR